MKEIQLVGANHGIIVPRHFDEVKLSVEPPLDFFQASGFDDTGRVGVELSPNYQEPVERGEDWWSSLYGVPSAAQDEEFAYQGHPLDFFVWAAEEFGHKSVDYLEDSYFRDLAIRNIDHPKMSKILRYEYLDELMPKDFLKSIGIKKALANFIDSELKEPALFTNIAASSADTVFIGRAHAERLLLNPSLQDFLGIRVSDYVRTEPIETDHETLRYWRGAVLSRVVRPSLSEIVSSNREMEIERELIRRRYNTYSIGRVLNRGNPKPSILGRYLIGDIAAKSLFELHFTERQGNSFKGKCYDLVGDADIEGEFDPGARSLEFTKVYDEGSITERSRRNVYPLLYLSSVDQADGLIRGFWCPQGDRTPRRGDYAFKALVLPEEAKNNKTTYKNAVLALEQR